MAHIRRVGRPQAPLPRAESLLTARIRAVVQLAHGGNLAEASRATGIAYPTLRDLHVGRTVNPSMQTLQAVSDAYGLSLDWFRLEAEPEELPLLGRVGFVPPRGAGGRAQLREVLFPFAAWSMYDLFVTLEERLGSKPATAERPVVGEATGEAFVFRLSTFLLQPLLAAERAGTSDVIMSAQEYEDRAGGARAVEWVERLSRLGDFWWGALPGLLYA